MFKKIIIVVIILIGAAAAFNYKRILSYFEREGRTINTTEVKLLFKTDPTLDELAKELVANGVIADEASLITIATDLHLSTDKFAAGKYIVLSGTKMRELLNGFVKNAEGNGNAEVKVNVIFNRCRDIYDIGGNISKCILADSASIVDYILSEEALNKYHFTAEQVPALFLPDSYEMYFDTDAEEFVAEMAKIFKEFWNEERKAKMISIGLSSPSQVATLASIVYSEQGKVPEEWPVIASLYLNRLKKGMKLQSDPTFKFCWGRQLDGVQRLLARHRNIDCPYNTYKYDGLPPGPIYITPASVIDAVLSPESTDYIFMCAKPDYSGEHNFTASANQHERNATVYRNWLKNELRN